MKTFEVCVLKSFDDFGSFAADGLTVKLACRHTKSARGRNYYFVGVFKLFESIVEERVQHRHQRRGQELFCRGGVSGRAVVRQTGDNPIGLVERRTEGCSGICNRNGPRGLWLRWCESRDIILCKGWFGAGLHRNKRLILPVIAL